MKIGELANKAQCTTETIRYYEKIGLLPEGLRGNNNYRYYDSSHLERLVFIRNCRALEMSHQEIKELIELMTQETLAENHNNIHLLLDQHLEHIDNRIQELASLRDFLIKIQGNCSHQEQICETLDDILDLSNEIKKSPSHV